jgi:antitoxin (DNA-binding transcriptional repressor) of toxin-antitoxin stability system
MASKLRSVGIREFREDLAQYVSKSEPVALTRHGRTVGYFIPATDPEQTKADLEVFLESAKKVQGLLSKLGVTEEGILDDFRKERQRNA